jgi:hypothetical protein
MPTQEEVRSLFEYRNGKLYWKVSSRSKGKLGQEAGTVDEDGYRIITIKGRRYARARLTYLYFYGLWSSSKNPVDHKNRIKLDDRIGNLRMATQQNNNRNVGKPRTNTSGFKGVTWDSKLKKWRAYIHVNNKRQGLGGFENKVEAAKAYDQAATEKFGEFAVLNFS